MVNKHVENLDGGSIYTGQVEIKVNRGNSPYRIIKSKNTGTTAFHYYILKALIDGKVDLNLKPYGIKLYTSGGRLLFNTIFPGVNLTTEPQVTDNSQQIKTLGVTYQTGGCYIKYHFLIPENFCNGSTCKYVGLCNGNGELYAISDIGDLLLESGSNIDVTWTLTVNSSDENTTVVTEGE